MPRTYIALLATLAIAAIASAFTLAPSQDDAPAKAPIIINMTAGAEDVHSFWMGLQLADHALTDGREATVFMNVNAPLLASTKAPDDLRCADHPTPREQIAALIEKGAKILVCPGCMKLAGLTEEDLLPGLELGSKEALFGPLDQGGAVFSY